MRRAPRAAAGLVPGSVLVLVLAACGGGAEPSAEPEERQPATEQSEQSVQPERLSVPEVPEDLEEQAERAAMSDLAALAEQKAAELPRGLRAPVEGGDISWPQCPRGQGIPERRTLGLPMPLGSARFVVMGLTNGPAFFPNPCLAEQVAWVRERGLLAGAYAVASYPDPETLAELGERGPYEEEPYAAQRNVGYQQALFDITTMRDAGLPAPLVWIDVEPVRDWEWSDDLAANAAVVEGLRDGLVDKGYRVGIYSTAYLWSQAVGDLSLGDVPEWRAAGPTSRAEALRRCEASYVVQGGSAAMGQWVADDRDLNVTCPGTDTEAPTWFHAF